MQGRHSRLQIQMSQQTRATLQRWLQRRKTAVGQVKRACGMLLLEQGHSYTRTARWVGMTERNLPSGSWPLLLNGIAMLIPSIGLPNLPIIRHGKVRINHSRLMVDLV